MLTASGRPLAVDAAARMPLQAARRRPAGEGCRRKNAPWLRGGRPRGGAMPRSDEDFSREVEAHLQHETDRLIADGVSPEEARRAARRAFGNVARVSERFYESRRVLWLD